LAMLFEPSFYTRWIWSPFPSFSDSDESLPSALIL
jgi:hypothetical protein